MSKRKKFIITIFILLLCFLLANLWASYNWLVINCYEHETSEIESEVKIVVISDLHEHEFGTNNEDLIEKIKAQTPDLLLVLGDFVNKDSKDADVTLSLIESLVEDVPVYFALGNHELDYMENSKNDLVRDLEEIGAIVLDKEYIDINIRGNAIRLGAMYEYAFGQNGYNEAMAAPQEIIDFLEDFQNTDNFKIMMSHRPDSFIFGDASTVWDVDLVVSGHNHGGQVVVPFLGGVYGGDQGYFPEYVHGMYEKDDMHIFVTSGLGSDRKIVPRFNNRPEIAVLKLF